MNHALGGYFWVACTLLCTVAGQFFVKRGALQGVPAGDGFFSSVQMGLSLLLNPYVITGLLLAGVAALAWIIAMNRLPLATTYPIMALSFPLVTLIGAALFSEVIGVRQLVGTLVIVAGVYLAATQPAP